MTIGFLKNLDLNLKKHVCNKYNDLLTMAYSLKDIAILNAKVMNSQKKNFF